MRWVTFYPALNVPIDVRGVMTSKEVDVDVVKTGAPSGPVQQCSCTSEWRHAADRP